MIGRTPLGMAQGLATASVAIEGRGAVGKARLPSYQAIHERQ